jgi:hypothetical protein
MEQDVTNLKIDIAVINEKLDNQSKKIDEVLDMLKQHIIDEEGRYKEIMEKKADKWTEKFIIGLISLVCLTVFGAILALVINQ